MDIVFEEGFLSRTKKVLLYLLVAVFFYSHSAGLILVGILLIGGIVESLMKRRLLLSRGDYIKILLLFISWSIFVSVLNHTSLHRAGKFAYYIPLLLSSYLLIEEKDIKRMAVLMVAMMALAFPLSIAFVKDFRIAHLGEFPLLGNHIPLAHYISTLSLISASICLIYEGGVKERIFWLLLAVLMMIYVVFTGTRSFYVALPISLIIMAFFVDKKKTTILVILLISLSLLSAILLPDFAERFKTIFDTKHFVSNTTRLMMWKLAWKAISLNIKNFLLGIGLGGWQMNFPDSIKEALPAYNTLSRAYYHVHNIYLQWWLETGLIGLILYIGFIILLLKALYRKIRTLQKGSFSRTFVSGVFLSVICYGIGATFDFLHMPRSLLGLCIPVAIAMGIKEDVGEEKDPR